MHDSSEELLRQIRLGEDTSLELTSVRFKGDRVSDPRQENLADEIAAIANTHDGVLVLGVDDKTRDIDGILREKLEAVERHVFESCNDCIKPPVIFRSFRLELPDSAGTPRAILKVEVPRSLFVHESPGGYFHRQGSSRRKMPPDYLARLFQQRSQTRLIHFDEQLVAESRLDDMDTALWRRFAGKNLTGQDADVLIKLGLAGKDEDGTVRPTVSGVLMAAPEPRRWLPNAFVQAVAYRGTTILADSDTNYQVDAADISGPLNDQITNACAFVKKNMKVAARKQMGRTDLPQYDLTAVFEAVVNAVAHRDYSIYGSKIRLRMFTDRLEIYSPGAIPNTMTIESLPFRQSSRNETVSSLLARCPIENSNLAAHRSHIMDKRGEGVPIILDQSAKLSGRTPEYRLIDNTELLLTIWGAKQDSGAERDRVQVQLVPWRNAESLSELGGRFDRLSAGRIVPGSGGAGLVFTPLRLGVKTNLKNIAQKHKTTKESNKMEKKRSSNVVGVPPAEKAIQLKVALRYIRPPIWRRVVLPDNFTLGQLHDVIQVTMGWQNCHLHAFRFGDAHYTSQEVCEMDEMDMENEETVFLSQVLTRAKQKFMYEYDFGDSWLHEIVLEKMLPIDPQAKYPVCLAGARACPPEDCGSFPGYDDILEAFKAPRKTKEQKAHLAWIGNDYDPERFDLETVNKQLTGKH